MLITPLWDDKYGRNRPTFVSEVAHGFGHQVSGAMADAGSLGGGLPSHTRRMRAKGKTSCAAYIVGV
jgi:hypothetical protein